MPSAFRHADLIVDSDVLKNTVFIKTVEVSSGAPPCDVPCDAPYVPCDAPYVPYDTAPLPGYLPHQAPEDACFVEEGCLGGTGSRKVHLAVHLAKYRVQ